MLFHVMGRNYRIRFKIYTKVKYQIQSTFETKSVKSYGTKDLLCKNDTLRCVEDITKISATRIFRNWSAEQIKNQE